MQIGECIKRFKWCMCNKESIVEKMEELCNKYPYDTAKYVMNPCGKYGIKNAFQKNVYGVGKKVPYLDFEVNVPLKTEFYLKQYYGDYMKYPSPLFVKKAQNRLYKI